MTLPLLEKTWIVFYNSGDETVWEYFTSETSAQRRFDDVRRAGYYPTKRPYHPTDAAHMTQEQAELLHAAADAVPNIAVSAKLTGKSPRDLTEVPFILVTCYHIDDKPFWQFFSDEAVAQSRCDELMQAGHNVTKRYYWPSDVERITQEHVAADSVPRLTASAEPDYFPGKPNADHVLVMRARIAAGCEWDGYSGHGDQEPEVRRILRDCAKRIEELAAESRDADAMLIGGG